MEKFSEFDKTKNSESLKKREIESIQTEEKDFFGKIKESALDVFHFASKENFKKTMRAFALATALLIPVGEKAFAEREEKLVEEPTVTIAQMDKEAVKASEAQESVAEQKELIKEKYNKEIIFGGDYSIEELRELDDALRIVQNLASKKFDDLKLGFIRPEIKALKNAAMTLPNVVSGLDELNKIIDKSDNNFDIVNNLINLYKKMQVKNTITKLL